jgi:hypothetical protein
MTGRDDATGLLAIDRLALTYIGLTAVFGLVAGGWGLAITGLHATAIVLILWAARRPLPTGPVGRFFRLLYPVIATPLYYKELAVLTPTFHTTTLFDSIVQSWEIGVFGSQISQEAINWLPWFWLSEFMQLGYLTYYFVIPFLAIAAWRATGVAGFHRFSVTVTLAFIVCYLWFVAFPVAGPRYWFGALEGPLTDGSFGTFTRNMLAAASSKGTAFPSSHVAGTVAAWFAAGLEDERPFFFAAVPVLALTIGTVWGGYHYAIDAAAGVLIAVAATAIAPRLVARAPLAEGA